VRKEEIFFDAITNIRENLVEEAQTYAFRRRVQWRRWAGPIAACLVLAAFLSLPLLLPSGGSDSSGTDAGFNGAPSAADQAAPESTEGAVSGEAPAPAQEGSDKPAAESPGGTNSVTVFNATVLEVRETELLVEPDQGTGIAALAVAVPIEGLDQLPVLEAGDRVSVTCARVLTGMEPAQAVSVTDVALLVE